MKGVATRNKQKRVKNVEEKALVKFRAFKKYWEKQGQRSFSDEEVIDYLLERCDCKVYLYKKS